MKSSPTIDCMRFEVTTPVTVRTKNWWDVTPCSLVYKHLLFRVSCYLFRVDTVG
jgi:hypothetical protein